MTDYTLRESCFAVVTLVSVCALLIEHERAKSWRATAKDEQNRKRAR